MKMKRWMDHFDFLTHNPRNNNQQFQLNNVKMSLRVQFQVRLFKCVNLQVFLLQDPLGGEEPAAALADVAFPDIEPVELDDGLILTCESSVKDSRASCRLLGISQAGSKGKMFERIKKSYVQGMRRAAIDMARAEYQREEHPAQPAHLAVRHSTQRERSLHELTRLPYRDWCPFCVSTRARGDYHASHADPDLAAARDRPTIQVDFYFCENRDKSEGSLGVKPILLMVDSWTRMNHLD